jgi:hypothetical protein
MTPTNTSISLVTAGVLALGAIVTLNQETAPLPPEELTYYAKIDDTNTVIEVIVADKTFIDSGKVGDPKQWVQTFQESPLKGKYAGKGDLFDIKKDKFISKNNEPVDTVISTSTKP